MNKRVKPKDFDFDWYKTIKVQKRRQGNPGPNRKAKYLNITSAFDIETTRIVTGQQWKKNPKSKKLEQVPIEHAIMYVWMYQIGDETNDRSYTIIGRTWDEFRWFITRLTECTPSDVKLMTFVHNLSYEFQFLRGVYDYDVEEVFALDKRKVLKASMNDAIEMRCSYIHSNMSLDVYTHKMNAPHAKLSGEDFDYKIKRYPWTKLSELELGYCTNDVLGLVESINIEMKHDDDNLYTLPLTSTGYVRRDAKKAMKRTSPQFVKNQLPNLHIYNMLRESFRGGNTHANRYYADKIIHNVKGADIASSYPSTMCNMKFPTSKFFHMGACSFDELIDLINVRKKAVLMRISMTNVELLDDMWGCPYLARSKCRQIRGAVYDNGRILSADYLETTITDVDLKIILSEYDYDDLVPMEVAHARYGKLPPKLLDTIIKYFEDKTGLKNVEGQEIYYDKSKNKLNSIYGMMVQNPVKQSIEYIEGDFKPREDDPQELLDKNNQRAFLAYQWGVWVTAWSRLRLEEGIRLAGEGFIYCDTDSVYYVSEIDWEAYNRVRIKESKETGAHAKDVKGNTHYMGVFEYDGKYYEFSTLGAKKYCTRKTPESDLKITIAGVNKKKGGKELEKHGGIKAFKSNFIFKEAGGLDAIYNDELNFNTFDIDGHTVEVTTNVVLKDGVYTLGVTAEYEKLLQISSKLLDRIKAR